MQLKHFIYKFPHFGLEVTHDEKSILSAKFINLDNHVIDSTNQKIITANSPFIQKIIGELDAYCNNPLHKFNLPLNYTGTVHQLKVWQIISEIKSGTTLSYKEVAKLIGSAARAIGGACGRNPLPVFIPCHRIIAANNQLGGFNSGNIFFNLGIKKWLLEHEDVRITV